MEDLVRQAEEQLDYLIADASKRCTLDERSLGVITRKMLEHSSNNSYKEQLTHRLVAWVQQVYRTELPFNSLILAAIQLLYRIAPHEEAQVMAEYSSALLPERNRPWIELGLIRARLIEAPHLLDHTGLLEYNQRLLRFYTCHAIHSPRLAAYCVEACELAMLTVEKTLDQSSPSTLLLRLVSATTSGMLRDLFCTRDELLLHHLRSWTISLFRIAAKMGDDKVRKQIIFEIDSMVDLMEKDVKSRLLLLRDAIEARFPLAMATSPTMPEELLTIIVSNKSLSPAAADCLTTWIDKEGCEVTLFGDMLRTTEDPDGLIGQYLLPRLVKRLPEWTAALLSILKGCLEAAMGERNRGESLLLIYISLHLAFLHSEAKRAPIDLSSVRLGLKVLREDVRLRSFAVLCRSLSLDSPFEAHIGDLSLDLLLDMQLSCSSDSRQQTISSIRFLFDTLICRIYKLLRDEVKIDQVGPPYCHQEISIICAYFSHVIQLCMDSLTPEGFFNKNELCFGILFGLVQVWRERLEKYSNVVRLHGKLVQIRDELFKPLSKASFIGVLCECVVKNSFDTIRQNAANLIVALDFPPTLSFLGRGDREDFLEGTVRPGLCSPRAHLIDGAAMMLKLIATANNCVDEMILRLLNELEVECHKMSTAEGGFAISKSALGILSAQRLLLDACPTLQSDLLYRIIKCCKLVGSSCCTLVSHPSPEGHLVRSGMVEGGMENDTDKVGVNADGTSVDIAERDVDIDEEEVDIDAKDADIDENDLSTSAMSFCWRAIKESCALLVICIKLLDKQAKEEFFESMGEYLIGLLLRIRHPGAFLSISKPLRNLCQICFSSSHPSIQDIPFRLLKNAVKLFSLQPEVQTTRRSAGIPICLAAIVSASKDKLGRQHLLCLSIDAILGSLTTNLDLLQANPPPPQVIHALNILRQIFRESLLAEDVIPHLKVAFEIRSRAFRSPSWAVRNSGMLLFTALMSRTFGIRHDREEFSLINCIDIRTLHAKADGLLDLMQKEMDYSAKILQEKGNYQVEFSVYPILSIVQRIIFSTGGLDRHRTFYHRALVFCCGCLSSHIMKVRRMAARLLPRVAECSSMREIWVDMLRKALLTWDGSMNLLHGVLEAWKCALQEGVISATLLQSLLPHLIERLEQQSNSHSHYQGPDQEKDQEQILPSVLLETLLSLASFLHDASCIIRLLCIHLIRKGPRCPSLLLEGFTNVIRKGNFEHDIHLQLQIRRALEKCLKPDCIDKYSGLPLVYFKGNLDEVALQNMRRDGPIARQERISSLRHLLQTDRVQKLDSEDVTRLLAMLQSYRADEEMAALALPLTAKTIVHLGCTPLNFLLLVETYWTDYCLSEVIRLEAVKAIFPLLREPRSTRILYLAITDDDEDVRYAAAQLISLLPSDSPSSPSLPLSVPQALRHLLHSSHALLDGLYDHLPELANRESTYSRQRLFAPEALNSFKDAAWERMLLNRTA